MNGNLEPEERVLDDSLIYPGGMLGQLSLALEKLGWEYGDDVVVEMAGTQVSGIDVGEDYNKKWQSPIGTRKYNKDAFIVISNNSRRDLSKSQPFGEGEFNPRHTLNTSKEVVSEDDVSGVHAGVEPESSPSEG